LYRYVSQKKKFPLVTVYIKKASKNW